MKAGLALMRSVFTPLAKSVLISLGLAASASATYESIQYKIYGSGMTKFIIWNEKMKDITDIEYLEESDVLNKGATKNCYPLTM